MPVKTVRKGTSAILLPFDEIALFLGDLKVKKRKKKKCKCKKKLLKKVTSKKHKCKCKKTKKKSKK